MPIFILRRLFIFSGDRDGPNECSKIVLRDEAVMDGFASAEQYPIFLGHGSFFIAHFGHFIFVLG